MFSDYTTTKALVTDRQARLHHEAQQHRLARLVRRGRRGQTNQPASRQGLSTVEPLPAARPAHEGREAA